MNGKSKPKGWLIFAILFLAWACITYLDELSSHIAAQGGLWCGNFSLWAREGQTQCNHAIGPAIPFKLIRPNEFTGLLLIISMTLFVRGAILWRRNRQDNQPERERPTGASLGAPK
jgi:hypothetical protein